MAVFGAVHMRKKSQEVRVSLACTNIGTLRRYLKALVGGSFHALHDLEACCPQMLLYFLLMLTANVEGLAPALPLRQRCDRLHLAY